VPILTPGIGTGNKIEEPDLGSGMNIPDHIFESLEIIFVLKYLNSFRGIRIRDKHPESATLILIFFFP
jgi:hypothetical protein